MFLNVFVERHIRRLHTSTYRCDVKEKEREKKTIVNAAVGAVVISLCVCVCLYLLQKKPRTNSFVSVAYFILLRGQLQKRQSVQLDASTVIGQLGAQLAHRDASVLF